MEVAERNSVRRQGSACIGTSPPSSADLPGGRVAPPPSSPPSLGVPSSLLLAGEREMCLWAISKYFGD
jgi:hypothetical protein